MAPIPSPYFPEPITVPGNVAEANYRTIVRFVRRVAILNLCSMALIFIIVLLLMRPLADDLLVRLGAEATWLIAVGGLAALALLRHAAVPLQVIAFLFFSLFYAAIFAELAPFLADEFPDFVKTFAFTCLATWVGLVIYNLLAFRDYSLLGEFCLVSLFVAVALAVFTILTDVWFSQAFAAYVVLMSLLFYWIYDLAMILRRRTPRQMVPAALDLYRDLLNFVGFPVRMMRMPRRGRRLQN